MNIRLIAPLLCGGLFVLATATSGNAGDKNYGDIQTAAGKPSEPVQNVTVKPSPSASVTPRPSSTKTESVHEQKMSGKRKYTDLTYKKQHSSEPRSSPKATPTPKKP